jgi:diphthamide synthase (EF-2-diphthine--ammonia ligase)
MGVGDLTRQNPAFDVRALLMTITEGSDRISMHAIRESILTRQASEIGVPVVRVPIPPDCPDALYQQRMSEALDDPRIADVLHFAFGDLFLEDVRASRESQLTTAGKRGVFPLWGEDTADLIRVPRTARVVHARPPSRYQPRGRSNTRSRPEW